MATRGYNGRLRWWLTMVAALAIAAPDARAQPDRFTVLVLTGADQRPGFVAALRIQLAADADVVAVTAPPGDSLSERLATAANGVGEHGARLAVWLERGPDGSYVLYAVGRRGDRGVIEVGRVSSGIDADRELALKVGALVDELVHPSPSPVAVLAPPPREIDAELPPPPAPSPETPDPGALRWSGLVSAGATTALGLGDPGAQGGLAIGAGARLRRGSRHLELAVAGRWMADRAVSNAEGRATLSELGGAVKLGGFATVGGFEVGPELAVSWRRLATAARTTDDFTGGATSSIPAIDLVASARYRVLDQLAIALSLGGGVNLIAEEMTIRDQVAVDVRRGRLVAELGVVGTFFE